jgi:hypothetical protein
VTVWNPWLSVAIRDGLESVVSVVIRDGLESVVSVAIRDGLESVSVRGDPLTD